MFPQLVAGPIVRYETVANEITDRTERSKDITEGIIRFIYGLGKKILIANYVGFCADRIFSITDDISVATAWLGAITYSLQIYFDFSGYSDMAIGLGRIFGFHFPENFNYPYIAKSITEFWRRWHISLSTWFRDYVYIPLGGNRKSQKRWFINMFIVWMFTGIWHGANWTFIIWGFLYFVLIVFEKITGFTKRVDVGMKNKAANICIKIFSHFYTLLFIIIAWVIFRSPTLAQTFDYLASMFGITASSFMDDVFWYYFSSIKWILVVGILLSMPITKSFKKKVGTKIQVISNTIMVLVVFILSILVCMKLTHNPFLYFNF